jgi:hypothetical protein
MLIKYRITEKTNMTKEEDAWTIYEKLVDIEESYHGRYLEIFKEKQKVQ